MGRGRAARIPVSPTITAWSVAGTRILIVRML